ncbi:lysosome-associated membrane glycoprotein 1 [Drosophila albomicans]|uniref:Lysosome-associated membrane glycoprotein 5 n=1 Tax=Drosophila albomicans TaxID=7291 RepID=A0A6P8W5P9_DROAB|nr:lysosome-associated membrane glycoprotein 1 [Drosophila albomicans]
MFRHKILFCTALLLLSSSVFSQSQSFSLKNADLPVANDNAKETIAPETTITPKTNTTSTTVEPLPTTSTTTTTTTAAPPSTSTSAPNTTTAAPVTTTTPKPQPAPPAVGTWNCSCIMLTMAAQLNFTYETKSGNKTQGLYNIPSRASMDHCYCDSQTTQSMQLHWGPDVSPQILVLQLEKKNQTVALTLLKVDMTVPSDDFPDAKENQTIQLIHVSQNTDFKTPEKMSYHCTRAQQFNMSETIDGSGAIGYISVSHVQVEAFRTSNTTGFSTVHDCDSSETSDVVPIAVGIALAALIVVVLISYLCARRRSTSRGYMSF